MSHDAYNSFFTLFQLPEHLNLDVVELEKKFYALSRRLHPDRFAAKPASEQEAALTASSNLNDAYRTLKGPHPADAISAEVGGGGAGGAVEGGDGGCAGFG